MKYHTLFFLKIKKNVQNLLPAAVVIGALRVSMFFIILSMLFVAASSNAILF